jgi:hypothetical protein
MLAIVMVAALAAAGALVASAVPVGLAVAVAVPVSFSGVEVLDPPHAVANVATRHIATQNNPNLFILTLSIRPSAETRLSIRIGSKRTNFAVLRALRCTSEVAVGWRPHAVDGVVVCRISLVGQRIMASNRVGIAPRPIRIRFADAFSAKPPTALR